MDTDHPIPSPSCSTYLYEFLVQLVVHFSGRLFHHFDHLVLRYPKKECLHSNGIGSALSPLLFLFSCGKSLPSFEDIDLQAWKDDKHACQGTRSSMMKAMEGQSKKLLALSEQEVIALLGKPRRE
jgi:hypothetical protein